MYTGHKRIEIYYYHICLRRLNWRDTLRKVLLGNSCLQLLGRGAISSGKGVIFIRGIYKVGEVWEETEEGGVGT